MQRLNLKHGLKERPIEYLNLPGYKSATLFKYPSVFIGQSASFILKEPGKEFGMNFPTQEAAHREYKKNWMMSGVKATAVSGVANA